MQLSQKKYLRLAVVAIAIAICVWTIKVTATIGLSRLFVRYALSTGNLAAGNEAVRLTPKDAEAQLAYAEVLSLADKHVESEVALENAIALRPADYSLWLTLGLLRDQKGNRAGALAAFDEAVKRAPFYAQALWQRGNLLLRNGQYDPAFNDLNQAAQSDPGLLPNLVDLAWGISKGDTRLTEQLVQNKSERMRVAFARILARQGKASEAVPQFRQAGRVPPDVKRELVEQLLARGNFKEGFEIWRGDQTVDAATPIHDGGFEAPLALGQGGFGWRVPRTLPAINLSLDSSRAHSGAKSLRIEFTGDSTSAPPSLAQMILVEPSKRYRLSFAASSQELVSGGLPFVAVNSAAADRKVLGQSVPLLPGTRDWQVQSFEFSTPADAAAVVMTLQRQSCTTSPCPSFGSVWLDSFSLEQLK